ncbi:methylenetetrahydrofolate reductase, partial [Pseudomonas soli]|nr:methylenetetrahydrofolate reductase [Pseudomonas soli]
MSLLKTTLDANAFACILEFVPKPSAERFPTPAPLMPPPPLSGRPLPLPIRPRAPTPLAISPPAPFNR